MQKRKSIGSILVILLMVISMFSAMVPLIPEVSASPGNVYVSPDQGAGWYDATHVKTIQEGIDNVTAGDTVYVWDGTYSYAYLNKNASIIGNASSGVIIDAEQNSYGIRIGSNLFDIEIANLSVTNFTDGGIEVVLPVSKSYNITIHDTIVENSIVTADGSYGIWLFADNVSIYDVVVRNLSIGGSGSKTLYGMDLDGFNNTITNVELYNFSVDTSYTSDYIELMGITFITGHDNIVENASIYNFYWDIDTSIDLFYICGIDNYGESRNCSVHDLWFNGNYTDWVKILGPCRGVIDNCSVYNLSIHVDNETSTNTFISGSCEFSQLSNSTFSNFSVSGTSNKEVVGANITEANTSVFNCSISDISGIGVVVVTNNNSIYNNTITNNDNGIKLTSGTTDNTIYNNYFNNTNNAIDDGTNTWNTTKTAGTNIIGGSYLGGNYWDDYTGFDWDSDGLGDTNIPYVISSGDYLPLTNSSPIPSFTYSPSVNLTINDTIQFTDTSTGSPTAWNWSFGDGTWNDSQNPIHQYLLPAIETVTLTISRESINKTASAVLHIGRNVSLVIPTGYHTGYNWFAWSNHTVTNASTVSTWLADLGVHESIYIYNSSDRSWLGYTIGIGGTDFTIDPYNVVCVLVANEKTFRIPP